MIYRQLFTCLLLLTLITRNSTAFPPSSPAGGNYLALDGIDDYAVLDFKTFDVLLPKGTDEFTVEAWVYPTTPPDKNTTAMILSQQVLMRVVSYENEGYEKLKKAIDWRRGDLLLIVNGYAPFAGKIGQVPFFPITISPNQWYHIVYQAKRKQTTTIVNSFAQTLPQGTIIAHDLSALWHPKDFTLGGFGKKVNVRNVANAFLGSFTGYIDEVRISTAARYNVAKKAFAPHGRFKNDAKTVALWHFDEPGGMRKFSDASANAYHLVGKGGAKTGIPLSIEAQGKLTTTWGAIKQTHP